MQYCSILHETNPLTMHFIISPLTSTVLSILPCFLAFYTCKLSIVPIALVLISIVSSVNPETMHLIILPIPLVKAFVFPFSKPILIFLALFECPIIFIAIFELQSANSMYFVFRKFSIIRLPFRISIHQLTIPLPHSFHKITTILVSILED